MHRCVPGAACTCSAAVSSAAAAACELGDRRSVAVMEPVAQQRQARPDQKSDQLQGNLSLFADLKFSQPDTIFLFLKRGGAVLPIYEYECKACGHRLEKLQKITAPPLQLCPACEQSALRRLISPVAFRLKGGGWYETDFKDEKSRKNLAGVDEKAVQADTGKPTSADEKKKDNGKTAETAGAVTETKTEAKAAGENATASTPTG